MEPFKNQFSIEKVRCIGEAIQRNYADFSMDEFLEGLEEELDSLEMKARMKLVAERIEAEIREDIPEMFRILIFALDEDCLSGFSVWPFTEIVARKGGGHFPESMNALALMTEKFSAEFAIRPFIRNDTERTFAQLHDWCEHESEHVRRLVSEGSRTLLPWGGNLPELLKEPFPTLELLEKLYRDPSAYVRLSVSNHLNDFSKSHPELVLKTLARWLKKFPEDEDMKKLARHASRTLIKKGHPAALALQGYGDAEKLVLERLELSSRKVELGGSLGYLLEIRNTSKQPIKVMFDFQIHLLKANGTHSPKVFKGRARELQAGEIWKIDGKHPMKKVTTRVYHAGLHKFSPQFNGKSFPAIDFELAILS